MRSAYVVGALAGWIAADGDKAQVVRLLDVWLLGPLMMYAAETPSPRPDWATWFLAASGAATVTYNGRNYLERR